MAMTAIILAAGEGTRMKSRHPKVMHKLRDRPLVSWVTRAARAAGADRIVVVVGNGAEEVRAHLAAETDVECVEQTERLGTAHATRVAIEAAGVNEGPAVGGPQRGPAAHRARDHPCLRPERLPPESTRPPSSP